MEPNQENTNPNADKDVVFIDAYNLIYRAYHGNKVNLTNSEGIPTNALFTVIKMLMKVPKQFSNLTYAMAVFDGGGDNFRKEIDTEYKANRKEMPEDLKVQMPYIMEAFKILGWPVFQPVGVEADDALGSLAVRASNKGFNTYIISGDKDFRSIVKDNLNVIDTMNDICYTPAIVEEKMGVKPSQVRDYLALLGDSVDNVIGVDKVGKTTAAKLLNEYGDIEGIKANKDKIKGVVGENIRKAIDDGQLDKNISLIQLKLDVDVQFKASELRLKPVDEVAFAELCEKMNFKSLMKTSSMQP